MDGKREERCAEEEQKGVLINSDFVEYKSGEKTQKKTCQIGKGALSMMKPPEKNEFSTSSPQRERRPS